MAYLSKNLSLMGGANGFSHWHYRSTDAMETIVAAGYFTGDAPAQMGPKDMMTIEARGSTGMYAVASNNTGVSLSRIGDGFAHDDHKIYLYNFPPQVELLAGTSRFVVSPVAGHVTGLTTITRSAVTTGGTLTVEIATVAVPGLSNVVADASTAGTVVTDTTTDYKPLLARVAALGAIELVGDAAFATAGDVVQIIEIEPDFPTNDVYLCHYINEVDLLAGTDQYLVSPVAGQISRLTSVSSDDVTTGGSLIPQIGGVAVVGLDVVIANAGGVGDVDSDTPTSVAGATGTVAAGTAINIDVDSTFATAGSVFLVLT
ncbi:MAG: hypothetical protein HOB07_10375, partial [Chloroflexi bacterium]|nr:hypothetical protein [Chloroflexota bacterium]